MTRDEQSESGDKTLTYLGLLEEIRGSSGSRRTRGLADETIARFCRADSSLGGAISAAYEAHAALREEEPELVRMDEPELCERVQRGYVNFYPEDGISPYVALAGLGPWLVTTHGAVLHDSAGYGMLGAGHAPPELLEAMAAPWAMANVMTPSVSQKRLDDRLRREIGRSRGGCPFDRFICMNSGSEAVTVASRIADVNAKRLTAEGGPRAGQRVGRLAVEGGFHGRTYRPARISHSTLPVYRENLASFHDIDEELATVPINDIERLRSAFAEADERGVFFEAFYVEPVMGEGRPGVALSREFYDAARELTAERGTMLVVDSIQAALRAHGCLSIVDYPGFEGCDPPEMETYSKALNAGQYPLSVLAMTERAADTYVCGIYGNTMTTNPRALEVGCAVLDGIDDEIRANIRKRGAELADGLRALAEEMPKTIREVTGTGLLVNAEIEPGKCSVTGRGGLEEHLRLNGISMIHGGENGLRFTPHFRITSDEVRLIVDSVRDALRALAG
ncbi:MAG: aminotransferase class III-fold pyridoxal phosphate-dependent enzyme [Polyangia bacterium]